tara:strand:+ start:1188 stop:1298 length:111 start_codon:yes stop_codon:yes gene_type:complete
MNPWKLLKEIAGDIYTDEQIDEMTLAEITEILEQEK